MTSDDYKAFISSEEVSASIADLVVTVFSAVFDAIHHPNQIIPLHVFSEEAKVLIEDILEDISKEVDVHNIQVSLELIH
tara:strand:- start:849 stop:1085 length:237 start_codon:yes stop_codon:yes gene_type:complete